MMAQLTHSKLLQVISEHAASTPFKTAFITVNDDKVDYVSLWTSIRKVAILLQKMNLQRGDKILLSAQKEIEFVYVYFAAHLLGIVNVVVDAKNNKSHFEYIASLVKPKICFGCEIDGIKSLSYDFKIPYEVASVFPSVSENDTADIMFTSGTTGRPKGVLLTHHNIYSSASNINSFIGNRPDDVELLGLPICHSFGLGRIRCSMLTGATVVLRNGFANLKNIFNAIDEYGVSGFGMVPAVWAYIKRFSGNRIAKYSSQINYIEIGSAPMPIDDKKLIAEMFPNTRICMHYGLTEASRSVFMEFHNDSEHLDSIGLPVTKDVFIKILDEEGYEVSDGIEGELCIKGDMVTKSYFLPEDNICSFWGDYFRTGDWAVRKKDGHIYLLARKKELINVGGKKVSPVEIEEALENIGVGESMCVAIPDPQGVLGEIPKALLVEGTFDLSIEEIQKALVFRLESYKIPKVFEVVKSIPKTANGKKQRTVL